MSFNLVYHLQLKLLGGGARNGYVTPCTLNFFFFLIFCMQKQKSKRLLYSSFSIVGVTVKGHRHEQAYSFRLEDKGLIQSIKFNPDLSVLAIKRTSNSVEFLNF